MILTFFSRLSHVVFGFPVSRYQALAVHTGTGLIVVGLLWDGGFMVPDAAAMRIMGPEKYASTGEGQLWNGAFELIHRKKLKVLIVPAGAVGVLVELMKVAKEPQHQKYLVMAKAKA